MGELERRLRAAARANAAAATDTRAPRTVRRSIGRQRALLPGTLGVMGAVMIGSLAVGGLGLTDPTDPPSPSPTPDFSLDEGSRGYATVTLPRTSYDQEMANFLGYELCGKPEPQATADTQYFTAEFDLPQRLDLGLGFGFDSGSTVSPDPRVDLALTYKADDALPAFSGGVIALLLENGIVVAFSHEDPFAGITSFTADQTRNYPWSWDGWLNSCEDEGAGSLPPAGDYELMFVSRVHNDVAAAAHWSLKNDNLMVPAAQDLDMFAEGSYACTRWDGYVNQQPLTCSPNAVVGFELNAEAGTATVPYDTTYYTRDFNALFVSDPVPVTLGEVPEPYVDSSMSNMPWFDVGDEPVCGDVYSYIASQGDISGGWEQDEPTLEPGDTNVMKLWQWSLGWSEAHIALPQNPRIWLLHPRQVQSAPEEKVSAFFYADEVVGWIDTESSQSAVDLKAYDGPGVWPLTVADVQWCDGTDPSLSEQGFRRAALNGLIAEPFAVTLNDGTSYEAHALALSQLPY